MKTEREKLIAWCEGKLKQHGLIPGRYFYREIADALRETAINDLVAQLRVLKERCPESRPVVRIFPDGSGALDIDGEEFAAVWDGYVGLNAFDTIRAWVAEHERRHKWQKPTADTPMGTPCRWRAASYAAWSSGSLVGRHFIDGKRWIVAYECDLGLAITVVDDVLLADPSQPDSPPPADWAGEEKT